MSSPSDDHVAEIDADAEFDAPGGRDARVPFGHAVLHGEGAGDCFDDARKLDQQPVAGGLDHPPLVFGEFRIDQLAAQRLEPGQCPGLVLAHQPRVTRDIGREDGGETALDPLCAHVASRAAPAQRLYHRGTEHTEITAGAPRPKPVRFTRRARRPRSANRCRSS
jgi:hypothetical protein